MGTSRYLSELAKCQDGVHGERCRMSEEAAFRGYARVSFGTNSRIT